MGKRTRKELVIEVRLKSEMRSSFPGSRLLAPDYLDILPMPGDMRRLRLINSVDACSERECYFLNEDSISQQNCNHLVSECLYRSSWYLENDKRKKKKVFT